MADWNNNNPKTISMSFRIEPEEEAKEFFKQLKNDLESNEEILKKRIEQLFDEFVLLDPKAPQKIREGLFGIFCSGYQLGWNDHQELAREKI